MVNYQQILTSRIQSSRISLLDSRFSTSRHKLDVSNIDFLPMIGRLTEPSDQFSRGFDPNGIKAHLSKAIPNFNEDEDYQSILEEVISRITRYQSFNRFVNLSEGIHHVGSQYDPLELNIRNRSDFSFTIKGNTIGFYNHTCLDAWSRKVLFSLGVKKEFVEYVSLCKSYGTPVDPFAFKIVVDYEFYNNPTKNYSKRFLGVIKDYWIHTGLDIDVEFVDGKDLYKDMFVPLEKFKEVKDVNKTTIRKISDFCSVKNTEFLQYNNSKKRLELSKINIID